jgi:hypothetical protein
MKKFQLYRYFCSITGTDHQNPGSGFDESGSTTLSGTLHIFLNIFIKCSELPGRGAGHHAGSSGGGGRRQSTGSISSVADPGCLSRFPDPIFFHPDPLTRSKKFPDSGSASKNLKFLNPKFFSKTLGNMIWDVHPDLDLDFLPIPDLGS